MKIKRLPALQKPVLFVSVLLSPSFAVVTPESCPHVCEVFSVTYFQLPTGSSCQSFVILPGGSVDGSSNFGFPICDTCTHCSETFFVTFSDGCTNPECLWARNSQFPNRKAHFSSLSASPFGA